jgi:cyclopropane fatty-acyl-phospholipid synthase-like methyltransferase
VKEGLKPEHYLLDIGCGSLRGGVHFIAYLEPRHYFGIDKDEQLLEAGRGEIQQLGLEKKPSSVPYGQL